jgi:CHASE2 domain-containing sensor protein
LSIRVRDLIRRLHASFRERTESVHPLLPLLVVATSAMLLALDPFGVGAASHQRSEQATLRIMAPFYRPSGLVTAILIDDEYVARRNTGWPLSYADQGRLMRAVLAAKPAVLLIDLVYPHRHANMGASPDHASELIDPIIKSAGQKTGDIPVVFTAMAKSPEALEREGRSDFAFCADALEPTADNLLDPDSIQPELRTLLDAQHPNEPKSLVRRAYIRWSGCGDRYPLLLGGNPKTITPAFAAYRAFCERYPHYAECKPDPAQNAASFLHPMTVRSGAFPPSTQTFAYGDATCQKPGNSLRGDVPLTRRLWSMAQQLTLGIFKDLRTDPNLQLALPCPAVTVVPLSTLENATAEEWRELIAGKAVLIGANLTGHPDLVNTAVHHQIPGVLWHAMALDNLLTQGAGYLADRHEDLQLALRIALIALFAYLFPFIVRWIEHRIVKSTMAKVSLSMWLALAAMHLSVGHIGPALIALGIGIALDLTRPTASAGYFLAVMVAAAMSAFSLWQGAPPGNWFGLVIVLIAFSHTIKPYYHGDGRKSFPHKASVLGSFLKQETVHE